VLPLVTVEGRAVADPELRFAPSGVAVCKMRLVASKRKQDENGQWVDDKVFWITATCFKDLAEHTAESVVKGDLVTVVGRLQTDEWETESGDKRSAPVLIADSVAISLQFRVVPHSAGRAERSSGPASDDAWATSPASDEPPF
jgi:single-strand DNA-binding protein